MQIRVGDIIFNIYGSQLAGGDNMQTWYKLMKNRQNAPSEKIDKE